MTDVRLASVRYAADGINIFELAAASGAALTVCAAGSRLELALPNGLMRTYFIAERTRRGTYLIGVRRDPDGRGSKYLHDKVRVGTRLRIEIVTAEPLDAGANHVVVAAEDIGIFAAWSYARALDAIDAEWTLFYDAWSRTDAALLDQLRAFGARVRVRYRSESHGAATLWDAVAHEIDSGATAHVIGSQASFDALKTELARAGRLLSARIAWTSIDAPRDLGAAEFDVVLARSEKTVVVHENETILDAVRSAGVDAAHFCAAGICGTCRTRVLEGVPRHLDAVLTAPERALGNVMMICRSRALGPRLVLDM